MKEISNLNRELYDVYMKAIDEYYKLRDAKSNGCCHGMSLYEIAAYDRKVEEAVREMHTTKVAYLESLHA